MRTARLITLVMLTLVMGGAGAWASARPPDEDRRDKSYQNNYRERTPRQERNERARARLSLDQAVSMAERRYGARVVRAEAHERNERVVYVLRLLNDAGRVWTVRVDAATGDFR
jgi:uncharacterized membrane protein YkoI